ncbi:hypothetical protein BH09VER1_BH09VER1_51850 [soil metagenome]
MHSVASPFSDLGALHESALIRMQLVMGPLPSAPRCPLKIQFTKRHIRDGIRFQKLLYSPEAGDQCPAWLLSPEGDHTPRPALLCCHQTISIGKDEPIGLGGSSDLHFALELAQRGYVLLVPDYPGFGEYHVNSYALGYSSTTMKGIWNHLRGVDLLSSLPEVAQDRIGAIGHSLGGHNAMFLGAFDPRIRLVVTSCGFTRFTHNDNEGLGTPGDISDWSHDGYMPLIRSHFNSRAERLPFDFPDVMMALLPRPLFINAPIDDFMKQAGVQECVDLLAPLYGKYGEPAALEAHFPQGGHDFPPDVREAAYKFIEKHI